MTNLQQFQQIIAKHYPNSKLLRVWHPTGGVSAQITAIEIEKSSGQKKKLIIRQYGNNQKLYLAKEFKLLQILVSLGLPVATPCYSNTNNDIAYIIIEYIEGIPQFSSSDLNNFLLQFATHLVQIHSINYSNIDLSFLPDQQKIYTDKLNNPPLKMDISFAEKRLRNNLLALWPLSPLNPKVLLHGDFWPGNVLWQKNQLIAVIDWEDAALGDPLADLANSRLEILWAFGNEAMEIFTRYYQSSMVLDYTHLSHWDLCAALRSASKISSWGLEDCKKQIMYKKRRLFVEQALEDLL